MHISLDSALGRQRRLNSVGESVLQIAPNAAAAYSLRSLTGGDPKVVRVRRASDNGERDFTSTEITSGEMVSWVNRQVIAPLDIQALEADGRTGDFLIAKAAYALRSLGTRQATLAATGDTVARANGKFVVQVRRSSDDALKSFTADEVTDGTLLAFVNQIQTVGTAVNGTGSFDNYTVSNLSTTGFSANNSAGGTGSAGFPYVFKDEDVLVVKYTVTNFSSTSSLSPALRGVNGTNSVTGVTNSGTAFTANGTYTDTLTATADGTHLMYADGNTGSYTISDFEIVSHSSSGFVKTWYDQSVTTEAGDTATGNHAVQATAAEQPKIVSAGALVDNGLDFDGSDDKLNMPTDLIASINSASAFLVAKSDTDSSSRIALALSRNSPDFRFYVGALLSSKFHFGYQDTAVKIELSSADTNKHLFTSIAGSSNAEGFLDGTSKGTVSSAGGKSALSSGGIGAINIGNFWDGTIQEIVVYNTDQTDNRGAIEANIGEAYSITGIPAYDDEVDGFVETWYDQSGNSKDAIQATAGSQPKIVDEGSLVTSSGLASIKFDGTDDTLTADSLASVFSGTDKIWSHFSVTEFNNVDNNPIVANLGSSSSNSPIIYSAVSSARKYRLFIRDDSLSTSQLLESGTLSLNTPYLNHATTNGAAQAQFVNSNAAGTGSTNTGAMTFNRFTLGAFRRVSTASFYNGSISEFIIHNTDQSSNRVAIETNINSHYSIF